MAWKDVGDIFNTQFPTGNYRTANSLKKCYENIKKETRKQVAYEKLEMRKTGDEVPNIPPKKRYTDLAFTVMNAKTVYGLNNIFDCDHYTGNSTNGTVEENHSVADSEGATEITKVAVGDSLLAADDVRDSTVVQQTETDEEDNNLDWGDCTPNHLRTPLNKVLGQLKMARTKIPTSKSRWFSRQKSIGPTLQSSNITNEYSELPVIKKELVMAQLEAIKEEREEKKLRHELIMENLRLDVAIKKEQIKTLQRECV